MMNKINIAWHINNIYEQYTEYCSDATLHRWRDEANLN